MTVTRLRGSARRGLAVTGSAIVIALAGAALSACSDSASAAAPGPNCATGAPKLTVVSSGQASTAPDMLTISMGINVSDATAVAALSDANQRASTLTATLASSGVPASDIQSTNFSISPTIAPDGTVTGYGVSNSMVVTLHNLANDGQVIDAAASSVGNAIRVEGLSFSVSNTGDVDGRARANAVTTAAAHARAMTAAAGEAVGGVCSLSDAATSPSPYLVSGNDFAQASAGTPSVPLLAGTQQATAQVTVVYSITRR